MRKPVRSAVKAPRKSKPQVRRLELKAPELSPDEVVHLEQISRRFAESEKAWLSMTAPPDGEEPWTQVEEHMLARRGSDQDRRWKYFSK